MTCKKMGTPAATSVPRVELSTTESYQNSADPAKQNGAWQDANQQIFDRLDIAAVYRELGVRLADTEPNGDGWISCHAAGRDDRKPSAGINIATGRYKDFVSDESLGLFDFAAKYGNHVDWKAAQRHYAEIAGVTLPNQNGSRKRGNSKPSLGPIVATYDYVDESGSLLYQAVRYEPKGEPKDFRQRRPDGKGGFSWSVKGVRKVPYRLQDILTANPERLVVIPEGEKDVDRLREMGIVATCNVGGAGKWQDSYSEILRDRDVVIIADNDKAGRCHAEAVANSLLATASDRATTVRVVYHLPNSPPKGDVSDWLDAGGTKEQLLEIIKATPLWQPDNAVAVENSPREFEPFPVDVLPEPLPQYIDSYAKATCCDATYIALPLLSALAAAVGNSRRILLKKTWKEPCVIWTACIGESGTTKSPALDAATSPLQDRQNAAFREHDKEMQTYGQYLTTYEIELQEWKRTKKSERGAIPQKPDEPIPARYVCSDTTVEAIAVLLEQHPRGLLLCRDELGGWINSFDAYKSARGADVGHWLSIHRTGSITSDRKTGKKTTIHVERANVSICGTIQPATLKASLGGRFTGGDDTEPMATQPAEHFSNGLAARFLFAYPPRKPKRWTDDDVPGRFIARVQSVFNELLGLQTYENDDGEHVPWDIPMSSDGRELFKRFYNSHAIETNNLTGDLAAVWSKLEGYAARFALLIHLVRYADGDPDLTNPDEIDERSVEAGITLSRWFADESARIYHEIGGGGETADSRQRRELSRLVEWIQHRGGRVTVRDVQRGCRHVKTSDDAESLLNALVAAKSGDWTDVPPTATGGRPTREFILSTPVDVDTTPENAGVS